MFTLYQGNTCPATMTPTGNCTLGGYPSYAVNASNVAQIQLAVNFARSLNIRLIVKNTGHDFNSKSAGAGALSVWTHNLVDLKYIANYTDSALGYSGPAFKAGSGVLAKDLYAAAKANGVTVVGGEGAVSSSNSKLNTCALYTKNSFCRLSGLQADMCLEVDTPLCLLSMGLQPIMFLQWN
jgi:hypothetical protein